MVSSSTATAAPSGPRLTVTVPDLGPATSAAPSSAVESAATGAFASDPASSGVGPPTPEDLVDAAATGSDPSVSDARAPEVAPEPVPPTAPPSSSEPAPPEAPPEAAPAATQAPPPAEPAQRPTLDIALADCGGCSVIATFEASDGGFSAAEVATAGGRVVLLSIAADGQVAGVVNVPYGASFPTPPDGALPCDGVRCVVIGRQSDGRAILSAFEITDSGAWRDVSGDDAFPSASERGGAVDLDSGLGVAVQDRSDAATVWLVYGWNAGEDRFAPIGCAPDGPTLPAAGLSVDACLS